MAKRPGMSVERWTEAAEAYWSGDGALDRVWGMIGYPLGAWGMDRLAKVRGTFADIRAGLLDAANDQYPGRRESPTVADWWCHPGPHGEREQFRPAKAKPTGKVTTRRPTMLTTEEWETVGHLLNAASEAFGKLADDVEPVAGGGFSVKVRRATDSHLLKLRSVIESKAIELEGQGSTDRIVRAFRGGKMEATSHDAA